VVTPGKQQAVAISSTASQIGQFGALISRMTPSAHRSA